jgi:predicted transcriptional regulator
MTEQRSLEDLLVDEEQLNKELLANTVGEFVNIGKDSGDLIPNEAYNNLNSMKKVVVALLAQKARFELDMTEEEWLSPSEISELSGVKKGTVYPNVRDLVDEGVIRDDDGEYVIPSVKVEEAKEYLVED